MRALLSLGIVLGFGATRTLAYWTDTASMTTGSFTAGSLDLRLNGSNASGPGTDYANTSLTWSGLLPAEAKAFDVTVNNVGDAPFTYLASVTKGASWTFVDNPITVRLFTGSAVHDTVYPQVDTCSGVSIGSLQRVDGTNRSLIDAARRLAANSSESICVLVGLATDAANGDQGKAGSLSFGIAATQAAS